MRLVALFGVLLAAYAATLALPGRGVHDRSAREARYLMVATSLDEDGDLAVADQYRERAYRDFHRGVLVPPAEPHAGRLLEPVDLGLGILAAPLLSFGGVAAVSLLCAAAMALAMTLGAVLARRIVPDPWASAAALAVGLSPPALGAAAAIGPEPLGAALLAGATICALRVRDAHPSPPLRLALACAVQLALLPWLSAELSIAGLVVAAALVRWMMRAGRGLQAIVATEAIVFSAIVYVSVTERLFGGLVPKVVDAGTVTGADGAADHLARVTRLVTLWADPGIGLLAWAPVLALGFLALWCSGGRGASGWPSRCRASATPRSPRRCARSCAAPSCSSRRSSPSRRTGRGSPACTWSPSCRSRAPCAPGDCGRRRGSVSRWPVSPLRSRCGSSSRSRPARRAWRRRSSRRGSGCVPSRRPSAASRRTSRRTAGDAGEWRILQGWRRA